MLLVFIIFVIWYFDIFILSKQVNVDQPFLNRIIFWTGIVLFILAEYQVLPPKPVYFLFFVFLGVYLVNRHKREQIISRDSYYSERDALKRFLRFTFSGILLKWFWGVLFIATGLGLVTAVFPSLDSELAVSAFLTLLSGLWMIVLIKRFERQLSIYTFGEWLGLGVKRHSLWINLFLPMLTGVGIAATASYFFVYHYRPPVTPLSELLDWTDVSWAVGFFLGAAVIAAPFIEEVVFRGFFFKMISELKNAWWAFLIVAGIFGFLHMEQYWGDWAGIALVAMLGFLLTGFRWWTGSARPAIVLHYTFNICMVIIPVIFLTVSHPTFSEYLLEKNELSADQRVELLEASIQEDPGNVDAYDELARHYLEQGENLEQALQMINQALEITPNRTIYQYTKAEILQEMGRLREALAIFEMIDEAMPGNEEVSRRIEELRKKIG
ncbi:MAG: CPBP family glutamic-type intramembrane protease [Candidatus Omnitrophota bacterium]